MLIHTATRSLWSHRGALAMAMLVAGCGASRSTSPPSTSAPQPPPPALPTSAIELLPATFDSALRIDFGQLRKSPLWAYGMEVARTRCLPLDRFELLTRRTEVLVGGTRDGVDPFGAGVLQGQIEPADANALLDLFASESATPSAQRTSTARGRFHVIERAPVAASALGNGLAVVGDLAALDQVLDVADGAAPNARTGLLSGSLGKALGFETATAAVVYTPSEKGRAELAARLGRSGRAAMPKGLLDGSRAGLAVQLGDVLELRAVVESANADDANALTLATQSSLMQLNLLLRLSGLPPLLDRVAARTEGTLSVFSLQLTQAEFDSVWQRLQDLLAAEAASCAEVTL